MIWEIINSGGGWQSRNMLEGFDLIPVYLITRMTSFIKTKFKISHDQTNIDKYRLAANIINFHTYYI